MTTDAKDDSERQDQMAKFEHMFRSLGRHDVEVTDLTETASGRVVRLQLPASGKVSLNDLKLCRASVEIILHLRPDTVRFEYGEHAADIIMSLNEHINPGSNIEQTVIERIGRIILLAKAGDDEAAHIAEDELYRDAMDAIASSAVIDPIALARTVTSTRKISFHRHAAQLTRRPPAGWTGPTAPRG